jgi:type IV pilus assembly protein PilC
MLSIGNAGEKMPFFSYSVLGRQGEIITGKLEAENAKHAARRLRKSGCLLLEIKEIKKSRLWKALRPQKKISAGELSFFSRQLAALLAAGIPLTSSLQALGEQAANPFLGKVLKEVAANVASGLSFSESLRVYPEVFSTVYTEMVRAGELGGTLESILKRLSRQLESEKKLKDSIRSAMLYPVLVLFLAVFLLVAVLLFIVPALTAYYPPEAELPRMTVLVINSSSFLRSYWHFSLAALLLLASVLRAVLKSNALPGLLERIKFSLPIAGSLMQKNVIARFSRTLSTLLAGGIPVLAALETAGSCAGSRLLVAAVTEARKRIREGESIAKPLKESGLFPPLVTLMISVGEESGDLTGLLNRVADFYEAETAALAKGLSGLIEPLLIIGVGAVVGLMIIAVYLPLFSVFTQLS